MVKVKLPNFKKRGPGRPRICPVVVLQIYKLRDAGYTYRAIARELNICQMTVWRYLRVRDEEEKKLLEVH